MISIVIAALATYGISRLVSSYDGPYDVFIKIRQKYQRSPFSCTVCLSVWLAIPISIYLSLGLIDYLSIIGIVILVDQNL